MKKIFVTGSEGFIGSHIVERLVKDGFDVKALVLYNSFNNRGWLDTLENKLLKNLEIIQGDIRSADIIDNATKGIDCIINLASLIAIPYSYLSPQSYVDTNVNGTLNILQSAIKNNVKKIIHTSTSEVYGSAQKIPIDESHPLVGQSPYAASKIAADQLAYSFFASYNLPITIVRPFNTYGPRQSARAFIPTIILQMLNNQKKIKLGSLTPRRDLTYILDTVEAFMCTLKIKDNGEIINLGTGYDFSIEDVYNQISTQMDYKGKLILDKKRVRPSKSEVDRLQANNHKAKKILNWKPKYVNKKGLKMGLEITIDWFKENQNLFKSDIYNV